MYSVHTRKQFRKDFKKLQGTAPQKIAIFKEIIQLLSNGKSLPHARKDHALTGQFKGCRECHLSPDWLLIYMIDEEEKSLILVRTGSHSELF